MNLRDFTDQLPTQEFAKLLRLEPQRSQTESMLGSLALLGAGALVGATVALFLAPKRGAELRHDVRDQLRSTAGKIAEAVDPSSSRDS
jgi:hypothetical protein